MLMSDLLVLLGAGTRRKGSEEADHGDRRKRDGLEPGEEALGRSLADEDLRGACQSALHRIAIWGSGPESARWLDCRAGLPAWVCLERGSREWRAGPCPVVACRPPGSITETYLPFPPPGEPSTPGPSSLLRGRGLSTQNTWPDPSLGAHHP